MMDLRFVKAFTCEEDACRIMGSSRFSLLVKCCTLFSFVLMIILAFDPYVWIDEVFSLSFIKGGYADVIDFTAHDVHPPLYYLMLKAWVDLLSFGSGDGVVIIYLARLFSALAYLCTAFLCWRKLKESDIARYIWLLLLCLFALRHLLILGLGIRMYGWGMFFVVAVFLYAFDIVRGMEGWKTWGLLSLFSVCAAYIHNFALITSAVIWLLLLLWLVRNDRRMLVRWMVCALAVAVLYFPWLFVLLGQVANVATNYWAAPLNGSKIWGLFGYNIMPLNVFFPVWLVVVLWTRAWSKITFPDAMGICTLLGLILIGVVLSLTFRPVFIYRYTAMADLCFLISLFFMSRHLGDRMMFLLAVLLMSSFVVAGCKCVSGLVSHHRQVKSTCAFLSEVEEGSMFVVEPNSEFPLDCHNAHVLSFWTPCEVLYITDGPPTIGYRMAERVFPNLVCFDRRGDLWKHVREKGGEVYLVMETEEEDVENYSPGYAAEPVGEYTIEDARTFYKLTLIGER